jgi:penicillin-binding protein A
MMKAGALIGALFILTPLIVFGMAKHQSELVSQIQSKVTLSESAPKALTKDKVKAALEYKATFYEFPSEIEMNLKGHEKVKVRVNYSFDSKLQKSMEALFKSYTPDYGAFVAMDAQTGKVLSMVSYSKEDKDAGNLALRASFPSASVFKVVTAVAAIEGHKISANTVIPFNGRNHTLFKHQIFGHNITRWTHFTTLKDAFAKSINTVFGRLGAFTVGPHGLRLYADRFGFNRKIAADLPIQEGKAPIPEDQWGLAETASGYTVENTMSPLQGALIAASVANNGVMMEPFAVESIHDPQGQSLYSAHPQVASVTMDGATAQEIRALMRETVTHGTSRGSFKGFFKRKFSFVDVGGKTGSLTGYDPKGKYDWFVGYARYNEHRIAVAALTIHEKHWRVKSSYLARRAIENYFKDILEQRNLANR